MARVSEARFLAISPKAASFIVLDAAFLDSFLMLCQGQSPRQIAQVAVEPDVQLRFVQNLLELMVLRNFLHGTETMEEAMERPTLHLYVTNRCNLRCTHCYMSSGKPLPQGEMTTADRLAVIDAFTVLNPKGRVSFSGGEAMTDPDLMQLIRHARAAGHRIELYTNGLLVREANAQTIVDLVDELQISLDGTSAPANDAIRGRGSFDRIVRAINLIDAADRGDNPGFLYRIGITLTTNNRVDLEENLAGFLAGLQLRNPHRIKVGIVGKIGRASSDAAVADDIDALAVVQARIMSRFVSAGRVRLPNLQINRYSRTCGIGSAITVAADGKVYPCTVTDQPALGDMSRDDPVAVMQRAQGYREATQVDNVEGCARCSLRYFCQGMCRITNLHQTGSMLQSRCPPSYKAGKVGSLMAGFGSYLHHDRQRGAAAS